MPPFDGTLAVLVEAELMAFPDFGQVRPNSFEVDVGGDAVDRDIDVGRLDDENRPAERRPDAAPIAVYVLAMVVADASTTLRTVLYFSVPVLYFVLVTVLREHPGTRGEADDFT